MTKICESFAGGFAQIGRTLDRPPQPIGLLRMQKNGKVGEIYGRFMGGSDRNTSNSGRFAQFVQFMQMAQSLINTGYFASC
ncbi:MAG: hypothetical protein WB660_10270 [Candidatus Sulfotelmatobacter sp.]